MKTFSEIANYLLKKGLASRADEIRRDIEGKFIVDPKPVTIDDIKDKPWFTQPFPNYGRDFKPDDIYPGMIFMYKNYILTIDHMQILEKDEVVSILCHISGQLVSFIGVVSIEVINKSLYIGSAKMEDSGE